MIGKDAFAATWTEMEIQIIGTLVRLVDACRHTNGKSLVL